MSRVFCRQNTLRERLSIADVYKQDNGQDYTELANDELTQCIEPLQLSSLLTKGGSYLLQPLLFIIKEGDINVAPIFVIGDDQST